MITGLRPYQEAAVRGAVTALREHRSALVVMPTGTGKTQVFVALASLARRGRVLMLAHRDELVAQAAARVRQMIPDATVGIEKAERRANGEKIVVGSVQSMRGPRLERWPSETFSLVIIDEAHHASATTYRAIAEHFASAKILGVTATPDRTDERALGTVFETVAYEYTISEALEAGYLVPPRLHRVELEGLDVSGLRKGRDGDFVATRLEEVVIRDLERAAAELVRLAGSRTCLAYLPGVKSARLFASLLRGLRPGCAQSVDESTHDVLRAHLLEEHAAGRFQYLANCLVLTEGYDSPSVSCLAMLRPTTSRSLYAQMLGRGLRPTPGKTDCLVVDFNGCTGRHTLAGPEDVLGGDYSDEEIAEARRSPDDDGDVRKALRKSRERVRYLAEQAAKHAAAKKARKAWSISDVEAAERLGVYLPVGRGMAPTPKQVAALRKFHVEVSEATRTGASILMDAIISRCKAGMTPLPRGY